MTKRLVNLRVGVVQFNPKLGHVQENITRAREMCRKIEPKSIDLLCFPEMAFTGYAFGDATAILPHLEQPKTGATSQFCSEIAKLLQCYVLAGYPERLAEDELAEIEASAKQRGDKPLLTPEGNDIHQVGANSAVFYGPDGVHIGGYRKTHLYHMDKSWAKPGTGFTTFTLPSPLQTLSLGICMDLNPQIPEWSSEGGPFEIADYCLEKKSNVLILLNAWLDSRKESDEERDWSTLNYWAVRARPLWMDGRDGSDTSDSEGRGSPPAAESILDSDGHETVMIVCNRSGEESDNLYAGSSAIFSMQRGTGRPKLLDAMERREEDIRIWNIKVPESCRGYCDICTVLLKPVTTHFRFDLSFLSLSSLSHCLLIDIFVLNNPRSSAANMPYLQLGTNPSITMT